MKNYFKSIVFTAIGLVNFTSFSTHAEVPLFNFTLTVQDVSNPQVFLGKDKKSVPSHGPNTFNVRVGKSDYIFLVKYEHNGQSKEALCPISGAPTVVTAIINPLKSGREACITQESHQNTGMAAL